MILWHVRNEGSRFHIDGAARSCAVRSERLRGFESVVKREVAVAKSLDSCQHIPPSHDGADLPRCILLAATGLERTEKGDEKAVRRHDL